MTTSTEPRRKWVAEALWRARNPTSAFEFDDLSPRVKREWFHKADEVLIAANDEAHNASTKTRREYVAAALWRATYPGATSTFDDLIPGLQEGWLSAADQLLDSGDEDVVQSAINQAVQDAPSLRISIDSITDYLGFSPPTHKEQLDEPSVFEQRVAVLKGVIRHYTREGSEAAKRGLKARQIARKRTDELITYLEAQNSVLRQKLTQTQIELEESRSREPDWEKVAERVERAKAEAREELEAQSFEQLREKMLASAAGFFSEEEREELNRAATSQSSHSQIPFDKWPAPQQTHSSEDQKDESADQVPDESESGPQENSSPSKLTEHLSEIGRRIKDGPFTYGDRAVPATLHIDGTRNDLGLEPQPKYELGQLVRIISVGTEGPITRIHPPDAVMKQFRYRIRNDSSGLHYTRPESDVSPVDSLPLVGEAEGKYYLIGLPHGDVLKCPGDGVVALAHLQEIRENWSPVKDETYPWLIGTYGPYPHTEGGEDDPNNFRSLGYVATLEGRRDQLTPDQWTRVRNP